MPEILIISKTPADIADPTFLLTSLITTKIYHAYSFEQGLQLINSREFSVIVADVSDPAVYGRELLCVAHCLTPHTPLIVVSDERDTSWPRVAFAVEAFAALTTPAQSEVLLVTLESALKKSAERAGGAWLPCAEECLLIESIEETTAEILH